MLKLREICLKFSMFCMVSIMLMLAWVIVGAVSEAPIVAGGSWFEYMVPLFAIWTTASCCSEMVAGKRSINNFIDMITTIIAIIVVIAALHFEISFESVKTAIISMKAPAIVTIFLALFVSVGNELIVNIITKGDKD